MRRERLLASLDLSRRGLEIGALNKPIVTPDIGRVEYIDRAPREELQRWYEVNPEVDVDDIVPVDHVWGEQRLVECVGGERVFAWLVASHVIEHVPDLIGWLTEISEVLEDGGVAVFMVPDYRVTFDIRRRPSNEAEVIAAWVTGARRPGARQVFDHFFNFEDGSEPNRDERAISALDAARRAEAGEYIDTHCWVFTPNSLLAALDLASRLGALPYEIATLEPTAAGQIEFLLALKRLPEAMDPAARRAAFLASAERVRLPGETTPDGARVAAIEASTSWRITAPLRALARRLGR